MRILTCALCLLALASSGFAATGTIDLYSNFNLIALPNVPLDPTPSTVFSGYALDSNLSGWDPVLQSGTGYVDWAPELFGNLLLGEGYWLWTPGGGTVSYDGLESGVPATAGGPGTDMWISLPGYDSNFDGTPDAGGWQLIGNPYAANIPSSNISFTDGVDVKDWQGAIDAGWVADNFQGFDGELQSGTAVDINGWFGTELQAARGYNIETYVPNLAMIITAP